MLEDVIVPLPSRLQGAVSFERNLNEIKNHFSDGVIQVRIIVSDNVLLQFPLMHNIILHFTVMIVVFALRKHFIVLAR